MNELVNIFLVSVPVDDQIWSKEQVAEYLGVSPRQVIERYATKPDFPKGFKIGTAKRSSPVRWMAIEVIEWAKSFR